MSEIFDNISMNETRFLNLLEKLIGESKYLQNSPSQNLIPIENLAIKHIIDVLEPYKIENGGMLEVNHITFVEGRGNLIIKYPGIDNNDDNNDINNKKKICSFVGSHLDVVPADPSGWIRDPFHLYRDNDILYGRGTTDCLGHIAMLTDFICSLAELKLKLKTSIVIVFIANEENGTFPGIGVDQLAKEGYLDELKDGPLFWIDSADSQPCIGRCYDDDDDDY